jgi:CTP:molybdopterin cytidylyltransferase MocA
MLIGRRYREVIDNLDENVGLRSLAEIYKEDLLEVNTNSPGVLKDFDTEEDYQKETNK